MTAREPGFLSYAWADPSCRGQMLALLFLAAAAFLTAGAMYWLNGRLDMAEEDIMIRSEPLKALMLSPHSELRAYQGYLQVIRHGTCTARIAPGVLSAVPSGTKEERVLLLEYADGQQQVRCGPAGWHDAVKAADMIMKYAGGSEYG